jgi:putative NIF3 family GTP cyclohydrolase 1 type 2
MVTGDIKHHDALQAQALGVAIVDVSHTATERAALGLMAETLEESSTRLGIEIARSGVDTNPFQEISL